MAAALGPRQPVKPGARDPGIELGRCEPGRLDGITGVHGVTVGLRT